MSAPKGFEEQSAALDALRALDISVAEQQLRKTLGQRNNFLVAKAARIAAELCLAQLSEDMVQAFWRFMPEADDPVKTDPQCWAKNDLAKALAAFQYQDHGLFLAGMRHRQMEPVWGGRSDTAGALRGTCALALVQCREINNIRLLGWLTELFADKDITVRVNGARAIEQTGSDAAMLLLKLRAELASDEPEVLGACYGGVLRLEGPSAIPWVAKFLAAEDDAAAEAALVIAETRTAEAFEILKSAFTTKRGPSEPWFRNALLAAIALTRQQEATEWLLQKIAEDERDSADAHEALCRSAPAVAVLKRLQQMGKPCKQTS